MTQYSDISPRTQVYAEGKLLVRALPNLITDRLGQQRPLASKSSKVIKFRRYESLARSTTPLAEGVTPSGQKLSYTDVTAILEQYGDVVNLTDVIEDTHEDPVLNESMDLCGEQAAEVMEMIRMAVLKAGTSVAYANGAGRTDVNTTITRTHVRKAIRDLKGNKAMFYTQLVKASPNYATSPIAPAFWALAHTDLEADIRNCAGFQPYESYAGQTGDTIPGEIGVVDSVRFVLSPLFTPWADAGAAGATMLATTNAAANVDVYPVVFLAKEAFGIVPFKGRAAVSVYVNNPGKSSKSDPLAQRGSVGWKAWQAAAILNDAFMYRLECAATANPT